MHQSQVLSRATSVPCASELPRRSLEVTPLLAGKSKRNSVDAKASRAESTYTPLLQRAQRSGLVLEVGRSVDLDEERKRLERNWNSDDLQRPSTEEAVRRQAPASTSSTSSDDSSSSSPRSHLEMRWQSQSNKEVAKETNRSSLGRRRSLLHQSRRSQPVTLQASSRSPGPTSTPSDECQNEKDSSFVCKLTEKLDKVKARHSMPRESYFDGLDTKQDVGLLDRETEAELGRIVQLGLSTERRLSDQEEAAEAAENLQTLNPESLSEDDDKLKVRNGKAAQHLLRQYNLRLLGKVAYVFQNRGLEIEDLIVEGFSGLERAIAGYDPSRGCRFSTYAYLWIRQAVNRAISEHSRVVRLPGHIHEHVGRIKRVQSQLSGTTEGPVKAETIAQYLGLPVEKVELYLQAGKVPISLDDPVKSAASFRPGDQEELSIEDILEDPSPTPDEQLTLDTRARLMKEDVDSVLNGLSIRERNILRYRYGLHTEAVSLQELSSAYGLTKERVRQIGEMALAKLQMRQNSDGHALSNGRKRRVPILKPDDYMYV